MPTVKFDRRSQETLAAPEAGKSEVIYWDEELPGFGLRILASGARTWLVRYRIGKKTSVISLAKAAALTVADARRRAGKILAGAKVGQDSRTSITKARAQASDTFGKLAEDYIAQAIEPRRRASYLRDVKRYLLVDAEPLHSLPVATVGRQEIARLLSDRAAKARVAAERCRVALAALFSWAMKQGRAEANPAAAVAKLAEPEARERALSVEELRAVWEATKGPGHLNVVFRLLMLTGQRATEVGSMAWAEIDARERERAVWSIPSERTKNGRAHDVPLSKAALDALEGHPRREGRALVFGIGKKGGFSGWSRAKKIIDGRIAADRAKSAGRGKPTTADYLPAWRIHDLRRSVITHMAEISIEPHVIEAVVNHISGHRGGVAGVYNRATYAEQKRAALGAWARWLVVQVGEVAEAGTDGDAVPVNVVEFPGIARKAAG